jgi:hypothetical protein
MLLYSKRQHAITNPLNIIIRRNVFVYKNHQNNKSFYIHIELADIFDCVFEEKDYIVTYPASYQKKLEQGIKEGKEIPLELFSTETIKLSDDHW